MRCVLGWIVVPALLAVPLAPDSSAAGEVGTRSAVIDRAISYHGGDRYTDSISRLSLCSKAGCSRLEVKTDGGLYRYQAEAEARGEAWRVVTTNERVQWWVEGEPREVPAEREQRLRDWVMARVYFAFLPYRLNDPGVFKRDLGIERWGDRDLVKIKVTFTPGSSTDADDEYLYWFDPRSGRLEQFAYSFGGNPGGLRFRRPHNYRRVGGILFFDQENLGVEGDGLRVEQVTPEFVRERMRLVSEVTLKEIEVEPAPGSEATTQR